ncbi:Ff.00g114410.m01.CDS01 [Fusarium sp. VM40]|nr:Ff.00g114410.m01.CDS01 [Fusarium sp. VM40]
MSGAEAFSLISGIITVIDAAIKIYDAAGDASGLPTTVRNAASRLPLIQESLIMAKDGLQEEPPQQFFSALSSTLKACGERVTELHSLFQKLIVAPGTSRGERYVRVMRSVSQIEKVKRLMDEIVADVQVLTLHHVIKSSSREQMNCLLHEITSTRSYNENAPVVMNSNGLGRHYVHNGVGDQNIGGGTGVQVNGPSNGSTFNFVQN